MRTRTWPIAVLAVLGFGCGGGTTTPAPAAAPEGKDAPKVTNEVKANPPAPGVDPRLKIQDVVVGKGREAKDGRMVYVLYSGTLMNGTEFDSNDKGGKPPFNFILGGGAVIKGWDLGLVGMKVGGKRILTIPADLAYGSGGGGDRIPPNSDLKFTVQLLEVLRAEDRNAYEVTTIKAGTGKKPGKGDTITLDYTGKLISGEVFDSSVGKSPLSFEVGVGAVVPGFDAGVQEMQAGGEYKLWIGPDAGYGSMGKAPKIGPDAPLIFEIKVKSITPGKAK